MSSRMTTILVTGANGNVSSGALAALKGKGHRLVGLVRDAKKGEALKQQGVEVRVGDLEKPRSLEGTFEGVETAFILTPPGPLAPYQSSNALHAARRAGVKHVLRMSAIGAAHDAPTLNGRMHALSDAELERSGVPFTIIKPHFFTQNLMMSAQSVAQEGKMYLALGDAKLPMIDFRDISEVAAKILDAPAAHAGKTYTLTGAAVSLAQVAAAIGEALGKPVTYVPVPVAAAIENLVKFGVDDFNQVALRDYFTAYSSGWQSTPTPSVQQLLGREPRTVQQFARDFAGAFGKR